MFSTGCISFANRNCCWIAATILFVFPHIGLSQSSEDELALAFDEEMISIATGGEQSLARAPAVASVITAKDIEAMGAQNLDQALESVPGLHVSVSPLRFTPNYSIRGIYTTFNPQVLLLINGIPMQQSSGQYPGRRYFTYRGNSGSGFRCVRCGCVLRCHQYIHKIRRRKRRDTNKRTCRII